MSEESNHVLEQGCTMTLDLLRQDKSVTGFIEEAIAVLQRIEMHVAMKRDQMRTIAFEYEPQIKTLAVVSPASAEEARNIAISEIDGHGMEMNHFMSEQLGDLIPPKLNPLQSMSASEVKNMELTIDRAALHHHLHTQEHGFKHEHPAQQLHNRELIKLDSIVKDLCHQIADKAKQHLGEHSILGNSLFAENENIEQDIHNRQQYDINTHYLTLTKQPVMQDAPGKEHFPLPPPDPHVAPDPWPHGKEHYDNIIEEIGTKGGAQEARAIYHGLAAYWKVTGQHISAQGLEHFLDNTGKDFTLPAKTVDEWIQDTQGYGGVLPPHHVVTRSINSVLNQALAQARNTNEFVRIYHNTGWIDASSQGIKDAHNMIGRYHLSLGIQGIVRPDGTYHVEYVPYIFDKYDYAETIGNGSITDGTKTAMLGLHRLESMGWAKNFVTRGTGTIHSVVKE